MALDFPAAGQALWDLYDATGLRPEYILPVLYHESAFDPSVQNASGAPYYGVGQNSADDISTFASVDPDTYMTWPASRQISTVVKGYFSRYAPLHSGLRAYVAEFLPAKLSTATSLSSVLTSAPDVNYMSNTGFDHGNKGFITVGDLAQTVQDALDTDAVKQAIADAYAVRPWELPLRQNGVNGTDFESPFVTVGKTAILAGSILGAAWFAAEAIRLRSVGAAWRSTTSSVEHLWGRLA